MKTLRVSALFLCLLLIFSAFPVVSLAEGDKADLKLPSLAKVYENYFLIGNVVSTQDLTGTRYELLKRHFNALTAENAMKPENIQPSKGEFTFSTVDPMVDTITADSFVLHGHTLAWHKQSPDYLYKDADGNPLPRAEAEINLKNHVDKVAGHYSGKVISWDVLNEAINDDPSNPTDWRGTLRQEGWYNAFANTDAEGQSGADYVDFIFREARRADPKSILYYNDYNLDNTNKAQAVAEMVKEINDKWLAEGNTRLLIEGVGMQGHYNTDTDVLFVEESLKRFIELGVEVSFTELDITVSGVSAESGLPFDAEVRQAVKYAELMVLFKKYSENIARVTFWGLDDVASWRANQFPVLFKGDLSAKQAYYAVYDPELYLSRHEVEKVKLQGVALNGTPVVDGVEDDIWASAEVLPISSMLQAWQTASGTAKVLWDSDNLYVLFQVTDDALDGSSSVVHERDSVEAFLDESNCKAGAYQADDGQYRVAFDNVPSFGDSTNSDGFESAVTVSGTNYTAELKIPFRTLKPAADMIVGFDAQVNDAKDGARLGISKWCDISDNSYKNTSNWGEMLLSAESVGTSTTAAEAPAPVEATPEPEATPESETAPEDSSTTGITPDGIIIIVGLALLVCVGVFFLTRRRK